MVPIRGRHGETGNVPVRGKAPRGSHRQLRGIKMKTPYDVLGISPDADEKTIAIAFREAAKRCHPDLNPGDHAAERFKQISAARDALSNPAWRTLYQYVQLKRLVLSVSC